MPGANQTTAIGKKMKVQLLNTINENLKHLNSQIQARAAAALKSVPANREGIELVTSKHLLILQTDPNPAATSN